MANVKKISRLRMILGTLFPPSPRTLGRWARFVGETPKHNPFTDLKARKEWYSGFAAANAYMEALANPTVTLQYHMPNGETLTA